VTLVLNQTLYGQPVNHYPVTVVITSSGEAITVNFFAPNLGEDAVQRKLFLLSFHKEVWKSRNVRALEEQPEGK